MLLWTYPTNYFLLKNTIHSLANKSSFLLNYLGITYLITQELEKEKFFNLPNNATKQWIFCFWKWLLTQSKKYFSDGGI